MYYPARHIFKSLMKKKGVSFVLALLVFQYSHAEIVRPEANVVQSNLSGSALDKQNISQILASHTLNIPSLDIATYKFVMSKTEPRENKIKVLWEFLIQYQSNTRRFEYLADIFSELEPIEKTDAIIQEFKKTHSQDIKYKYLELLLDSMGRDRVVHHPAFANTARNFLMQLLETNQNPDILRTIITNYPASFMDLGAYLLMTDRLNELKTKHAPTFNKIITNSSFWYHWLGLANRDAQFDLAWVKTLIKQSASFAHDADIASTINTKEQRGYTLSKDIRRAFNAALLSMEKQNKDFIVPQSIKTQNGLLSKEEDIFLTEEMKHILKALKEDRAMRASYSPTLGSTSRSMR